MDYVALASAVAAAISAALAWRIAKREAHEARIDAQIQLANMRDQYAGELRDWADETCDVLSDAVHACDLDPSRDQPINFYQLRHGLRCKLSSLLDRGRWFFPNVRHKEIGTGKPEAYRGLRQEVLDLLECAYRLVGQLNYAQQQPNLALRDQLVSVKKDFTSLIQQSLDPRARESDLQRLLQALSGGVQQAEPDAAPDPARV